MPFSSPGVRMHDGANLDAMYGGSTLVVVAPLTGGTVAFPANQGWMYINPAGTIAALTVILPPNPAANQKAAFSFGQVVTTVTVQSSTGVAVQTIAGAIGSETSYRFIGGAWVPWD